MCACMIVNLCAFPQFFFGTCQNTPGNTVLDVAANAPVRGCVEVCLCACTKRAKVCICVYMHTFESILMFSPPPFFFFFLVPAEMRLKTQC